MLINFYSVRWLAALWVNNVRMWIFFFFCSSSPLKFAVLHFILLVRKAAEKFLKASQLDSLNSSAHSRVWYNLYISAHQILYDHPSPPPPAPLLSHFSFRSLTHFPSNVDERLFPTIHRIVAVLLQNLLQCVF